MTQLEVKKNGVGSRIRPSQAQIGRATLFCAAPLMLGSCVNDGLTSFGESPSITAPAVTAVQSMPSALLSESLKKPIQDGYIVLLKNDVSNVTGAADALTQRTGGRRGWVYGRVIKGFVLRDVLEAAVEALARDPSVRLVQPNRQMANGAVQSLPPDPNAWGVSGYWGLDRTDHYGSVELDGQFIYNYNGAGVHIYIVDNGVRGNHVEFVGRIGNGACFVSWWIFTPGCDPYNNPPGLEETGAGHGTAVASAAAGATYGIAKGATIHSVRVNDSDENGIYEGDIVAGLEWIAANYQWPAVVNVSIGAYCGQEGNGGWAFLDAIEGVLDHGILVFKSAGNCYGTDAWLDRSNRAARSMVVGSTTVDDYRSDFSNSGATISLMAPGSVRRLASSVTTTSDSLWWGTSFAAPLAAGVAATIIQAQSPITLVALRAIMIDSASQVTIPNGQGVANRIAYSRFVQTPPPPPLTSVSIGPPSSVRSGDPCVWMASPTGGVAPFTYVWKKNTTVLSGQTTNIAQASFTANGTMNVTVTDATGASRSGSRGITVSPAAQLCNL